MKNWDLSRWIRLALGVIIGIYALVSQEYLLLLFTLVLLLQALFNLSCCTLGTCSNSSNNGQEQLFKDEITNYKKEKT